MVWPRDSALIAKLLGDRRRLNVTQLRTPGVAKGRAGSSVFVLVVLLLLTLPLVHRYLPLPDWPQHLAQDAIMGHQNDPSFASDLYYRGTGWFLPYQGFRLLHRALLWALGDVVRSGALSLSLSLALGVWAVRSIQRSLGRSVWVAVASVPLLIDSNFLWGFAPYVLATSLQWAQIALLLQWLDREKEPSTKQCLANSVLGICLFFSHIQPAVLALLVQAVLLLNAWRRDRVLLPNASKWVLSLLPCAVLCMVYLGGSGWLSGANLSSDFPMHPQTVWHPVWKTLGWVPLASGLSALGWVPWVAYLLALAALAAQSRRTSASDDRNPHETAQDQNAKAIVFVLALLALLMPAEFRGQSMGPRVTGALLMSVLWLWRPRRESLRAAIVIAVASVGSLLYCHKRFAEFTDHVQVLSRVSAQVPARSRVATLVYQPVLSGYRLPVMLHLSAYLLAERGGMSSMGFTRTGVTYRAEVPRAVLTVQQLWTPYTHGAQLTEAVHGMYYDYVFVVRGPLYRGRPFSDDHPLVHSSLQLREGEIELWRVTRD